MTSILAVKRLHDIALFYEIHTLYLYQNFSRKWSGFNIKIRAFTLIHICSFLRDLLNINVKYLYIISPTPLSG